MTAQQPDLTGHVPPERQWHPNNLPTRLVDGDGIVVVSVWLRYVHNGEPVGDCRKCDGPLYAEKPMAVNNSRTDYVAVCRSRDCGREVVFPNGRTGRWDATLMRGKRRALPRGMVAIAKNAAGVGQSNEDD